MVDHLTRVTFDARSPRAESIAATLAAAGFEVRRARGRLVADSDQVEGQAAKTLLRARGVEDREYQVLVEYVRQWGIL
jgi:hypothetical protein